MSSRGSEPRAGPGLRTGLRPLPIRLGLLEPLGSRGSNSFCCGEKGRILRGSAAVQPSMKKDLWRDRRPCISKWKESHQKVDTRKTKSIYGARVGAGLLKILKVLLGCLDLIRPGCPMELSGSVECSLFRLTGSPPASQGC